jgi:uncharacterized protein
MPTTTMPGMPDVPESSSPLTTLKRKPERGSHERSVIDAILDEGLVAHVGIVVDGQPFVIPMVYGRDGDRLLLHGSVGSRLLRVLDGGAPVCVTVTLLDALVLARSQFHHSMNYRSVVVIGTARRVHDTDACRQAVACVVEHVVPGRAAEARPPTDAELRQTAVLELPIEHASAKARVGGPIDEPDDLALDAWGGVLPVTTTFGPPSHDGQGAAGVALPQSLSDYRRARS